MMTRMDVLDRELEDRLVRYVQVGTASDQESSSSPSSSIQLGLQRMLQTELEDMGAEDIMLTDYGTLLATIPATVDHDVPVVAFLAHVDTFPGFSGVNVKPIVHRNHDGSDIVLPDDSSQVISTTTSPYLAGKAGEDIVTASGATLLGADDKAGVAIVMAMARHLLEDRSIPHGKVRIAFTPDEEIGRGVHANLPADLGADFAYTLDGSELGEVVYETFSADVATVNIAGVSTHPGQARDKMVNALHLAAKIVDTLPQVTRTPETTDQREGFLHVYMVHGNAAEATLTFIIRAFERDELRELGELLQQVCATIGATEPRAKISCEITPQYRNMRYWLENDMRSVELAPEACRELGIEPFSTPARGGTDGSRLTEMGVPTPNLFTGKQDFHGPLEWVSVQDMSQATRVCLALARRWSKQSA